MTNTNCTILFKLNVFHALNIWTVLHFTTNKRCKEHYILQCNALALNINYDFKT